MLAAGRRFGLKSPSINVPQVESLEIPVGWVENSIKLGSTPPVSGSTIKIARQEGFSPPC